MAVVELLDLNLSADRALKAVGYFADAWDQAINARQALDQRLAGFWERYETRPPRRTLPFEEASNLRVPLTMWVIDGVWVRMMRTVFGQKPYWAIQDENESVPPTAADIQAALQYFAEVELNIRQAEGHWLLNALVEGTGIGKLVRVQERRRVRDRVGDMLVASDVLDREGMGFEVIDLKDFAVGNAAIADINRQPWVGHRVWLRWDDIVRRQRDGIYRITAKQLAELKSHGKKRRTAASQPLEQVKADLDQAEDQGFATTDEWELLEVQGRYDTDGDGLEEESLFTLSLDYKDTPLRSQLAPFWNGRRNYVKVCPLPRSNRFYGRSLAAMLQPIQDEADAEVNQSLDASTFTILSNLTPVLPRHLKQEWERHKWRLGKPIYVDAPDVFRTLGDTVRYPIQLSTTQLAQLLAMAERVSGISDPQLGKPTAGSKTAYEIATVQSEGNVRFAEMVEQIQLSNQEVGYLIIEHAYQLSLESPTFAARLERVVGRDPFAGVGMADIRHRIAVRPTGNTLAANKEMEARKWLGVYQLIKDDPFVQMDLRHGHYLRIRTLRAAGLEQGEAEQIIGTADEAEAAKDMIRTALDTTMQGLQAGQAAGQTMAPAAPEASGEVEGGIGDLGQS